ncbi:MAG: RdgB/HAM1 family non-canonical purine NTP pyrophosphatase [Alphaproteobacteria bacterium]|nr:RdgB/HAM1 family non-canonical purine NTP pyrophosphatase [Alphaproteobacteria bacterium]
MRVFDEDSLLIATHNAGKAKEIADLLGPYIPRFTTAGALGLPEPEETGDTFAENAVLKARAAALASGLPALADDSGLCVSALDGAPGIYSARWAGPGKDFAAAMAKIHCDMGDAADRSAAFVCALALCWPDGHAEVFEGRAEGQIVWPMRGGKGFGYDPFFVPDGHERTFAEMEPEEKHAISHRARAFAKLVSECLTRRT